MDDATDQRLRAFLTGNDPASRDPELRRAVASVLLPRPRAAGGPGRHRELYRRMRGLNAALGTGSALMRNPRRFFALEEWVAVADPTLVGPLLIHHCYALGSVMRYGGPETRAELARLDTMRAIGLVLGTEAGHGSSNSPGAPRTEARHAPGTRRFTLHTPDASARKIMPGAALDGVDKTAVVLARVRSEGTDHGVHAFLLPLRDADGIRPGVRVTALPDVAGIPLDYSLITFDGAELPVGALLSEDLAARDDGVLVRSSTRPDSGLGPPNSISPSTWTAAASAAASVARAAVDIALTFARQRRTSGCPVPGKPALAHRNQQRALLDSLATAYLISALAHHAQETCTAELTGTPPAPGPEDPRGPHLLAVAKVAVCAEAEHIVASCRRSCGLFALFPANRLTEYADLLHVLHPGTGDSGLLRLDIGRVLSRQSRTPPGPGTVPRPPANPTDISGWLALAHAREERLRSALPPRTGPPDGHPTDEERFAHENDLILDGEQLVDAHVHRVLLEVSHHRLRGIDDPSAQRLLRQLGALHCLNDLEAHAASYAAHGLIGAADLRDLSSVRRSLYDAVLPHVERLVRAFRIPRDLLAAPMTEPDYVDALTWSSG
ncbi:acyl-CoA dehydrogenase [Streptomyces sp. NPDC054796]